MANQFNNYVWQGGYFPPAVQPAPQFSSTSSLQPQPVNPGPLHNPSSLHQYIPPHSPCTSVSQPTPQSATNFYLKIFNPANKKEFQLYTMRNLSLDVDNPDKLRQALSEQYGDLLPPIDKMEVTVPGRNRRLRSSAINAWASLKKKKCPKTSRSLPFQLINLR